MNLLFADTETTGMAVEDRLCQVCFHINGLEVSSLHRPPVTIKSGAMAIHKITNAQVEKEPPFIGSSTHLLLTHLQHNTIFVAHNAPFDLKMLAKEGISFTKVIDTLKVSRQVNKQSDLKSHALQNLRSYYGVEIEGTAPDAQGDVRVLMAVFEKIVQKLGMNPRMDRRSAIERMIAITSGRI